MSPAPMDLDQADAIAKQYAGIDWEVYPSKAARDLYNVATWALGELVRQGCASDDKDATIAHLGRRVAELEHPTEASV